MVDINTNLADLQKLQQMQDQITTGKDATEATKKKEESKSLFSSFKDKVGSAVDDAENSVKSTASKASDKAGSVFAQAKQKTGAVADAAEDKAKAFAKKTKDAANGALNKAEESAVYVKDKATSAAKKTANVAKNVGEGVANSGVGQNIKGNAKALKDVVVSMKPGENESFGQIAGREAKGVAKLGYRSLMAPMAAFTDFRPVDKLVDDVADGKFKSQEGESLAHTIKRDAGAVVNTNVKSNKIAYEFVGIKADNTEQLVNKAVDGKKISGKDVANSTVAGYEYNKGNKKTGIFEAATSLPTPVKALKAVKIVKDVAVGAKETSAFFKIAAADMKIVQSARAGASEAKEANTAWAKLGNQLKTLEKSGKDAGAVREANKLGDTFTSVGTVKYSSKNQFIDRAQKAAQNRLAGRTTTEDLQVLGEVDRLVKKGQIPSNWRSW